MEAPANLLPTGLVRWWIGAWSRITHNARPAIAQWAIYVAAHKDTTTRMAYEEVRPIPEPPRRDYRLEWGQGKVVTTDCSGFSLIVSDLAGVNVDPTGNRWDGAGYSVEFFTDPSNRHLSIGQIRPGDFVVYGPYGDEHIAVIVRSRGEALVCSHGHPGDPSIYPLADDTRLPRTFIRINSYARRANFPPKG